MQYRIKSIKIHAADSTLSAEQVRAARMRVLEHLQIIPSGRALSLALLPKAYLLLRDRDSACVYVWCSSDRRDAALVYEGPIVSLDNNLFGIHVEGCEVRLGVSLCPTLS